jgi:hypothetical protein
MLASDLQVSQDIAKAFMLNIHGSFIFNLGFSSLYLVHFLITIWSESSGSLL